ncbi:MAG: hypothetical protein DHS20C09_08520 [marine bacterium B5-7]|nr:MAG: hypothetical protein DHS20C09_08520 [marine bacterium B5-7]
MLNRLSKFLSITFTSVIITSCNTVTVIDKHKTSSNIKLGDKDSIVLLGRRHLSQHETERDYISCVGEQLSSGEGKLNVIPEKQFIDSMYPYFESSTAPMNVQKLDELIQHPNVSKKLADYKINFFIWIEGNTKTIDKAGAVSCVGGPAGCFGFATWHDEAIYEAKIWDLKNTSVSGKISTETQGTSFLPAVILPIPLLARVKSDACDGMATQLKEFLN